jgi:hypothetical protein
LGYIENLKLSTAKAEADRLRSKEVQAVHISADPRLMADWKPLATQISELMLSLPEDLRARPILISELIPQLCGRYNAKPGAGDVGQALRSLNYSRVRDKDGRWRWLPDPDTFS